MLPVGSRVGRYEVVGPLGQGATATVVRVRHVDLGSEHALKVLRRGDPRLRERLLREGWLMRALQHPHVASVTDVVELDGTPALVMELVRGTDLGSLCATGRLPRPVVEDLATQILLGLAATHAAGITHRDLKPANVMIGTSEARLIAKVVDFGLVRAAGSAELTGDAVVGTPAYMAPEQLRHASLAGPPADVWSLGLVLHELWTGQRLLSTALPDVVRAHDRWDYQPPADAPERVAVALRAALRVRPEERPADAAALLELWTDTSDLGPATDPALAARVRELYTATTHGDAGPPRGFEPHRLPAERDALFGRDRELEALRDALLQHRLVTLHGVAGAGKTRLAVRCARRAPDGEAWFCDLTHTRDRTTVLAAVARTLGLAPATDLDAAIRAELAGRGAGLLVLDNGEQVVDVLRELLPGWLDTDVRLLLTSRRVVGLPREHVVGLGPLPLPRGGADLREALDSPAVALFVDRARQARPGFALVPADVQAVIELVGVLDGLPLALELAAARIRILSPQALLDRMRDRFRLLKSGPAGQRSLLAALEASWELLDASERETLAQCSVFAGGFGMEAAAVVIDVEGFAPDRIQQLVDHALVRVDETRGRPRYGLFASVREFAGTRGSVEAAAVRHGRHFARLGTPDALMGLQRHGCLERLEVLRVELDNLTVAARRAVERGDVEVACQCAGAVWEVAEVHGPMGLGIDLLRAATGLDDTSVHTAYALTRLSRGLRLQGERDAAIEAAERAQALATGVEDPRLAGLVLHARALLRGSAELSVALGEWERAARYLGESGDLGWRAMVRSNHAADLMTDERVDEAMALFAAAQRDARVAGAVEVELLVLNNLGAMSRWHGQPRRARQYYRRLEQVAQQANLTIPMLTARIGLGCSGRERFTHAAFDDCIAATETLGSLGHAQWETTGLLLSTPAAVALGRAAEQLPRIDAAIASRDTTDDAGRGLIQARLRLLLALGRHEEVVALADEHLSAKLYPREISWVIASQAQSLAELGNLDAALARNAEALALVLHDPTGGAVHRLHRVAFRALQGHTDGALAELDALEPVLDATDSLPDLVFLELVRARLHGPGEAANRAIDRAAALLDWMGAWPASPLWGALRSLRPADGQSEPGP